MTFASDLLPLLRDIRAIPGQLGLHVHSVSLVESSWSGTHSGDGARADTVTPLLESGQNPHVKWLSDEALAIGGLSSGSIEIGPLTPDHDAVARIAALRGDDLATGDAAYILVTGPKHPNGAKYIITRRDFDRPFRYMIQARPKEGSV